MGPGWEGRGPSYTYSPLPIPLLSLHPLHSSSPLPSCLQVCLSDIQETAGLATKEDLQVLLLATSWQPPGSLLVLFSPHLQGQFGQDRVHFVRCDVTQIKEMEALYDQAEDYFQDKVRIYPALPAPSWHHLLFPASCWPINAPLLRPLTRCP